MKLYKVTKVKKISSSLDVENYSYKWEIETIIISGKEKGEKKTFVIRRHICQDPIDNLVDSKITLFDIYSLDEDRILQVIIFICIIFLFIVYIMYLIHTTI